MKFYFPVGAKRASQRALVVKNLPANAGDIRDTGLIPGSGGSPGGYGNPLQYSCLKNSLESFCLVQSQPLLLLLFCCSVVSDSLQPHRLQHTRLPCPSLFPGVCSNSCPLSRWCHPTILSSVTPFSSCLQSFPESGSFPMSWLFSQMVKVVELQLRYQSFQWIFRIDFI